MPQQTKRRRKRKHRGTQGGGIDRRGRGGRPRTKEEARAQAKRRSEARRGGPPTWRGAFWRGVFGAGIFFLVIYFFMDRPFGATLTLSLVMLALYVPLGYHVDRFFYRRRRAREQQERQKP
jgi:hypothetical protein